MAPPNIGGNLLPLRLVPLEHAASCPSQLQQLMSSYKGSRYMLAVQPGEQIPWWDMQERFMAGYKAAPHIAVALAADAKPKDILTAVLEAAYLRRQLRERQQQQQRESVGGPQQPGRCGCSYQPDTAMNSTAGGCGGTSMTPQRQDMKHRRQHSSKGCDSSCSTCGGVLPNSSTPVLQVTPLQVCYSEAESSSSSLRRDAKRAAECNIGRFMYDMQEEGWQTKPFLLSTSEKNGFIMY